MEKEINKEKLNERKNTRHIMHHSLCHFLFPSKPQQKKKGNRNTKELLGGKFEVSLFFLPSHDDKLHFFLCRMEISAILTLSMMMMKYWMEGGGSIFESHAVFIVQLVEFLMKMFSCGWQKWDFSFLGDFLCFFFSFDGMLRKFGRIKIQDLMSF